MLPLELKSGALYKQMTHHMHKVYPSPVGSAVMGKRFLSCCSSTYYLASNYFLIHLLPFQACGFKRKYWKSQNMDCIHQLEEVSVSLSTGYPNNALELATYILEHAPNLKKMVICYLPHQSYIIGKVNKSKIISSATVVFQKREVNEDGAMGESYYCKLFHLRW